MYRPLRARQSGREKVTTTLMARKGMNLRDLPQLMSPDYALKIQNYLIDADGALKSRGGLEKIFEVAGTESITMLERFTDDIWIFGYADVTAAYTISTDSITTIKNDWPSTAAQSGARYGEYFFVCNGSDIIHRIDTSLAITSVTNSPQATVLRVIGSRLYAGAGTAVHYSNVDSGSNPPFTSWNPATLSDSPGKVDYRNAGTVRSIESLGNIIIVFSDYGKWAFRIDTLDVGGVLTKVDQFIQARLDFGGARGAITTDKGIFYVNENGIWQMSSIGQENIPFSDQETLVSHNLGDKGFKDIDLSNADIAYIPKMETILVTCARDSSVNNLVLAYNIKQKAITELTGWNISRFMVIDSDAYGAGAVETKVWKLFEGWDDDGADIWTEYYQELNAGDLFTRKKLKGTYVQGFLSVSSELLVRYDIYDIAGRFVPDKIKLLWTPQNDNNLSDEYGTASWGTSAWGGDIDSNGMVECFDGSRDRINSFQRIRIKITSHGKVPHAITWISLLTEEKAPIRRRRLTLTS